MPAGKPPPSTAGTLHFPSVTSTKLTMMAFCAQQKPCKFTGKGKPKLQVPNRKNTAKGQRPRDVGSTPTPPSAIVQSPRKRGRDRCGANICGVAHVCMSLGARFSVATSLPYDRPAASPPCEQVTECGTWTPTLWGQPRGTLGCLKHSPGPNPVGGHPSCCPRGHIGPAGPRSCTGLQSRLTHRSVS